MQLLFGGIQQKTKSKPFNAELYSVIPFSKSLSSFFPLLEYASAGGEMSGCVVAEWSVQTGTLRPHYRIGKRENKRESEKEKGWRIFYSRGIMVRAPHIRCRLPGSFRVVR